MHKQEIAHGALILAHSHPSLAAEAAVSPSRCARLSRLGFRLLLLDLLCRFFPFLLFFSFAFCFLFFARNFAAIVCNISWSGSKSICASSPLEELASSSLSTLLLLADDDTDDDDDDDDDDEDAVLSLVRRSDGILPTFART